MGWDLVEEVAALKKSVAELERWRESLTVIPKSSVKKVAANKGIGDPKPVRNRVSARRSLALPGRLSCPT